MIHKSTDTWMPSRETSFLCFVRHGTRTSLTHSPAARVPLLCFYHILTSSVIYYWTDTRQHGIYLLNWHTILPQFWKVRVFIKSKTEGYCKKGHDENECDYSYACSPNAHWACDNWSKTEVMYKSLGSEWGLDGIFVLHNTYPLPGLLRQSQLRPLSVMRCPGLPNEYVCLQSLINLKKL